MFIIVIRQATVEAIPHFTWILNSVGDTMENSSIPQVNSLRLKH